MKDNYFNSQRPKQLDSHSTKKVEGKETIFKVSGNCYFPVNGYFR